MFNKTWFRVGFVSMLLTAVTGILFSLVACQEDLKKPEETLPPGVVLQKIEKGELISKSICTDKIQAFTVLSNTKSPLKIESQDKYFYTKYFYKIYLLPDKTYSGTLTSKDYDFTTDAAVSKATVAELKGLWEEKNDQLFLIGLGKIRKVKHVQAGAKPEDIKETSVELVLGSSFGSEIVLEEKIRTATLFIEQVAEGPRKQKMDAICAPVN